MADCLLDLLTLKCYCLRMKYDALRANAEIFPRRLLGESAAGYLATARACARSLTPRGRREQHLNARYGTPEARDAAYGKLLGSCVTQFSNAEAQGGSMIFPVEH